MKVFYDKQADAVYLELASGKPEGVVEIKEGVNLDMLSGGRISGIEILNASKKIDLKTILTYSIDEEALSAMR